MRLNVIQVDAWADGDSWTYNNTFPAGQIEVNGQPTKRKILKAMREKGYLRPESIYYVDDYFTYEGTWCIQLKKNYMPLYDCQEVV